MKKIQVTIPAPVAFAVVGAVLLTTGYALGQGANNPFGFQAENSIAEQQAVEQKAAQQAVELNDIMGDKAYAQKFQKRLTTDQLEVFIAYNQMGASLFPGLSVGADRFVNSYDKGKTDPRVIKEAAIIGITESKKGNTGPLLLANIVLQQRQVEQNDQIIALLQEAKAKK